MLNARLNRGRETGARQQKRGHLNVVLEGFDIRPSSAAHELMEVVVNEPVVGRPASAQTSKREHLWWNIEGLENTLDITAESGVVPKNKLVRHLVLHQFAQRAEEHRVIQQYVLVATSCTTRFRLLNANDSHVVEP